MHDPDVSVVVVTYNSAAHIRACVESVLRQRDISHEVIVVDNASQDGAPEALADLPCHVIRGVENLGFGRACNLGAESARGRFLYFLNPDAVMESSDSLRVLCREMDTHSRWGLAGTRVISDSGTEESIPSTVYPGQRKASREFGGLPGSIAWVIGASMFVRREVFAAVHGFDPDYFLYCEEVDLCLRIREHGHEIAHVSAVTVRHVGGASVSELDDARLATLKLKGLLLFMEKHYSRSDCIRLMKHEMLRARFRMHWNRWASRLLPGQRKLNNKASMYRAIWETNHEQLLKLLP